MFNANDNMNVSTITSYSDITYGVEITQDLNNSNYFIMMYQKNTKSISVEITSKCLVPLVCINYSSPINPSLVDSTLSVSCNAINYNELNPSSSTEYLIKEFLNENSFSKN